MAGHSRWKKTADGRESSARFEYGQFSAIEHHRPSPRRRAARAFGVRVPRARRAERVAWIGPETVALRHGAVGGYLVEGVFVERVDWDVLEWAVQFLLGYSAQVHGHRQPVLRRALQEVALMWPPLGFREAVHEAVWRWSCDPRVDVPGQVGSNVRRLRRARGILEAWSEGRPVGEEEEAGV